MDCSSQQVELRRMINVLATHHQPGTDELSSLSALLMTKGNGVLQIAPEPLIDFVRVGNHELCGVPPSVLMIGVGGNLSWADEHGKGLKNSSSFKLILERLGLLHNRRFKELEAKITDEDRHGSRGVLGHLSQVVKDLYDSGETFESIFQWYKVFFEAVVETESERPTWKDPVWKNMDLKACRAVVEMVNGVEEANEWYAFGHYGIQNMKRLFSEAQRAINPDRDFESIDTYLGKRVLFAPKEPWLNPRMISAARNRGAQIVISQSWHSETSLGTYIGASQKSGLSLINVFEAIRALELCSRNLVNDFNLRALRGEGTSAHCPWWHVVESGRDQSITHQTMLSGAKTRPDMEKTIIPFESIVDVLKVFIRKPIEANSVVRDERCA